jgi:hypothetical protein
MAKQTMPISFMKSQNQTGYQPKAGKADPVLE